jgi:hypothetical protein
LESGIKVLKIWDKKHGPDSVAVGKPGGLPRRELELGAGLWQHWLGWGGGGDVICWRNEAGGKEVGWEMTVESPGD